MKTTNEVVHYFRKNRAKTAIIYVRGHNQESQEVLCRVYAADKKYDVLFTTTDIEAVNNCDVLLVANRLRISRNRTEYHKITNKLKTKGIEVESVANQDNALECISLAMDLMK